MGRRHEQSHD